MSIFRVEKNTNYTVMSNHHLRDKRLNLKTIGLLSIILSLPENWDYTQAGLAAICKDGEDAIRGALKQLEQFGYLKRERVRDEKGLMKGTIYHIYENPEYPRLENPMLDKPRLENPKLEEPVLEKQPQIIKEGENTEQNKKSIHLSESDRWMDIYKNTKEVVCANINYDFFVYQKNRLDEKFEKDEISLSEYDLALQQYDLVKLDQIVNYMLDILTSQSTEPILIGGEKVPRELVKSKLLKVDMQLIQKVLHALHTMDIKNPKKYTISMLYNG